MNFKVFNFFFFLHLLWRFNHLQSVQQLRFINLELSVANKKPL